MMDSRVWTRPTGPGDVDSPVVWPSMGQGGPHAHKLRRVGAAAVAQDETRNPAHQSNNLVRGGMGARRASREQASIVDPRARRDRKTGALR